MRPVGSETGFETLTALVVEDNEFTRKLVTDMMVSFGFREVRQARRVDAALKIIERVNFDVVICDWVMEPISGIEFLRAVRKHDSPSVRSLPVVMLTALAEETDVITARDAGITEYLIKPFSPAGLFRRVYSALTNPRDFITTATYVGPDRRRRHDDAMASRFKRRLSDRIDELAERIDRMENERQWESVYSLNSDQFLDDLSDSVGRIAEILNVVEVEEVNEVIGCWRGIYSIAHDISGQAPAYGFTAIASVATSLAGLTRSSRDSEWQLYLAVSRRISTAKAHVDTFNLMIEHQIRHSSNETELLLGRLARAVDRVDRDVRTEMELSAGDVPPVVGSIC